MYTTIYYASYLAISILLTLWVSRLLQGSGRTFLLDAFNGNTVLTGSINRLLLIGFYLVNAGYIAIALTTQFPLNSYRDVFDIVITKLGVLLLMLGIMHFLNLGIILLIVGAKRLSSGLALTRLPAQPVTHESAGA